MSFRIGKIFGINIRIHYSLLLILSLVVWSLAMGYMPQQFPGLSGWSYWAIGIVSGVILIISVIIHELCHSIVANRLGLPIRRITLFFLGGASEMTEEPESPGVEFKMALVGPLSSFAIAAILGGLWYLFTVVGYTPELKAIAQYGATINLILGGFNLIPAFPLDGGRIFRSLVWRRGGSIIKATRKAAKVSIGISYLMMFGGFIMAILGGFFNGLWMIFLGWFIKSSAEAGLSQSIISQVLSETTVGEIMSKDVITVDANLLLDNLVKEYFLNRRYAAYPVLKEGSVIGLVTMESVKSVPQNSWKEARVEEVMTSLRKVVTLEPETPASDAMYKMSRKGVGRILVMEDGRLRGIVSRRDLTQMIKNRIELEER